MLFVSVMGPFSAFPDVGLTESTIIRPGSSWKLVPISQVYKAFRRLVKQHFQPMAMISSSLLEGSPNAVAFKDFSGTKWQFWAREMPMVEENDWLEDLVYS